MLAGVLLLAVPSVALAHDPRDDRPSRWIGDAANLPLVTSPESADEDVPGAAGISGELMKTNIVYTTDLVRGLDLYQVAVAGTDLGETDDSLLDLVP